MNITVTCEKGRSTQQETLVQSLKQLSDFFDRCTRVCLNPWGCEFEIPGEFVSIELDPSEFFIIPKATDGRMTTYDALTRMVTCFKNQMNPFGLDVVMSDQASTATPNEEHDVQIAA